VGGFGVPSGIVDGFKGDADNFESDEEGA